MKVQYTFELEWPRGQTNASTRYARGDGKDGKNGMKQFKGCLGSEKEFCQSEEELPRISSRRTHLHSGTTQENHLAVD